MLRRPWLFSVYAFRIDVSEMTFSLFLVVQPPDTIPADKTFHGLILGEAQSVVACCGIRVAIFCSLPEFTGV